MHATPSRDASQYPAPIPARSPSSVGAKLRPGRHGLLSWRDPCQEAEGDDDDNQIIADHGDLQITQLAPKYTKRAGVRSLSGHPPDRTGGQTRLSSPVASGPPCADCVL